MNWIHITWQEIKKSLKSVIFYALLMALYFWWFVSIFDPDLFGGMEDFLDSYPEALQEMVGGQIELAKFGGFMNIYMFSMAWFWFGFFFIMRAANDIPKEIENKTIDLMLSKPVKRWEFVLGKYLNHVTAVLIVIGATYGGIIFGIYTLPNIGPSDVEFYELTIGVVWLIIFLISLASTGVFFSTFLDARKAIVISIAIIIIFYVFGVYWEFFDESMENVKYLSIFYYFEAHDLLVEGNIEYVWENIYVLSVYSIVTLVLSIVIFSKRDIPV